ncbi:CT20-domain-containing protein [Nadsonia fulvescens var. elongata DSM 6958]|uniref:Chromatin modification-related protein EAF7 n=1 Tax=Nadsonia fulvescens var. elongata DSM 6958 TaxID=857566 RepID=A0A1E3PMA2_9ASCO|nr:CT20-domain-containing protein [Nadsonia fulvescens var. elongata DSM 6958]
MKKEPKSVVDIPREEINLSQQNSDLADDNWTLKSGTTDVEPESFREAAHETSTKVAQWTQNQEIILFRAICRFKPVGVHKHFRMISIYQMVNNSNVQGERLSVEDIWGKLALYYDLEGLEDLEGSSLIGEPVDDDRHRHKRSRRGESSYNHNSPHHNNHGHELDSGYNSGIDSDQLDELGEVRFLREFKLPWEDFGDMIVSQGQAVQSQDMSDNAESDVENEETQNEKALTESDINPVSDLTVPIATTTATAPVIRQRGRNVAQKTKKEGMTDLVEDSNKLSASAKAEVAKTKMTGMGKKDETSNDEDADSEDSDGNTDTTDVSDVENPDGMIKMNEQKQLEDAKKEINGDEKNDSKTSDEESRGGDDEAGNPEDGGQESTSSEDNNTSKPGTPTKKRKTAANTTKLARGGNKTRGASLRSTTMTAAKSTRSKPATKTITSTSRTTRASTRATNKKKAIDVLLTGKRKRGVKAVEVETGDEEDNDKEERYDNTHDDSNKNSVDENGNGNDDQMSESVMGSSSASPADHTDAVESELADLSAVETPNATPTPTTVTTSAPRRRGRLSAAEKEKRDVEKKVLEELNKDGESKFRAATPTLATATKPGRGRPPSTRRSTRKK